MFNFKALLTGGVIVGILGFVSTILNALGYPVVAQFIGDPATASNIQNAIDAIMYLIAGFSGGIGAKGLAKQPDAPSA